jgi:hypothetical protein
VKAVAPVTERAAAARAALNTAERRVGLRPHDDTAATGHTTSSTTTTIQASDKQLGLIVRLINACRADTHGAGDEATAAAIDAIGARFGITAWPASARRINCVARPLDSPSSMRPG